MSDPTLERALDVEAGRLKSLQAGSIDPDWSAALPRPGNPAEAAGAGEELWQKSLALVRSGRLDDRPLYWNRLRASVAGNPDTRPSLAALESGSRNYSPTWRRDSDYRVLVTGFDPFHLDTDISQSNPSGVMALSLDALRLSVACGTAEIRTMIVPVRFQDFDEGLIESVIGPIMTEIDMIITVSMGRTGFDLERFPGRRRSSATMDNRRLFCGGTVENPIVPAGLTEDYYPEFVEFSLPVASMCDVRGDFEVNDNCEVSTLETGDIRADSLASLDGLTAVRGSGGGYLSNEISYRVVSLMRRMEHPVIAGHIHVPRYTGYDEKAVAAIVDQGSRLIEAAVRAGSSG